jgi:hypothetical protein
LSDFHQLDSDTAFQFTFWVNGVMKAFDNAYYQHRTGMLDEDRWQVERSALAGFLENAGIAEWWRLSPRHFSPTFIALVEEILAERISAEPEARLDRPEEPS